MTEQNTPEQNAKGESEGAGTRTLPLSPDADPDSAFVATWRKFYSTVDDVAITFGLRPISGDQECVKLDMPLTKEVTQPAGMYSAAALFGLADIAATFLALEQGREGFPFCVQSSVNIVSNSRAARAIATATLIKTGRTLTVTDTKVHDEDGKLLAQVVGTFVSA